VRRLFVVYAACLSVTLAASSAFADPVLTAAGDIGDAGNPDTPQIQTAALIDRIDPEAVLTLGDNQYPDGTLQSFLRSYDPTWGTFKYKTYPTTGNHEYRTPNARGYFRYFGDRAHPRHGGYYAFDLGSWHLLAVNSGRGRISSAQLEWVERNLRQNHASCELVYWHHPLWSSGTKHGGEPLMRPLWKVLFAAGVDVVLNGHEHNYERFAPMRPSGRWDPKNGVRQFVVGTGGGAEITPFGPAIRNSQVRVARYGVVKLKLSALLYKWAFIRTDGKVVDRGFDRCHG
jgi:3',5'-cyclic AMP phosphodiesterase CpdA